MKPIEVYVAFWRPHTRSLWGFLGHVEVFGYTQDDTWFFIDPRRGITEIKITHRHDEVTALLAHRFANCSEVWRLAPGQPLRLPLLGIFTCVTVAASVCGVRAYSLRGLRRKLRAIGAVKVETDESPEGRPGGQEGPPA